jgi:predicted tellurium resistance membrane protein TerC
MATPLLVVIALIGVVDVVCAVDSIPAILAITLDPFIVLTSHVFAIAAHCSIASCDQSKLVQIIGG